ncbi:hypothetical protein BGZ76_003991 [Entomortierella beljakovae]|nr:hypothetical protein BGZ76_003991 [Entomortierella beljakovae]
MKPQIGQSKLAILKHAPTAHRKRRPIDLRRRQGDTHPDNDLNNHSGAGQGYSIRSNDGNDILRRTAGHGHHLGHGPAALLRRQTTRHKSFMELDLPSMKALRREPSMMELDPPNTLFMPAPTPSHFIPGPWAFFQAAEAQREQRQVQIEFLTRLQELRVRDEQLFIQLMGGFAKECPVQFGQLAGLMKEMEMEMEMGVNPGTQADFFRFQQHQQQYQQQQQQYFHNQNQNQFQGNQIENLWRKMSGSREQTGTKTGLLALAQMFGNQVQTDSRHGDQFQRQQHFNGRDNGGGRGGRGRGGRGGQGGQGGYNNGREKDPRFDNFGGNNGGNNGRVGANAGNVPQLRRGKTFQQQQQAMKQLTAYQRHLYQQVRQMHEQRQQGLQGSGVSTGESTPMAFELMQYAAMLAGDGNTNAIPPVLTNMPSPAGSFGPSTPQSPNSPMGFSGLMSQFQQQQTQQQDSLEAAAMNIQLNMGSSRRSRYKPPPLRSH